MIVRRKLLIALGICALAAPLASLAQQHPFTGSVLSGIRPLPSRPISSVRFARVLASAVEVTPAHISKLESRTGEPSIALLRKLANVLQVDLEVLAG